MNKEQRWTNCKIIAVVLAIIAVALLVTSFFLPPLGVVNPSVIQASAEIIGMIGIFFAWHSVDKGLDTRINHNNTSIEITNKNNKNEEQ